MKIFRTKYLCIFSAVVFCMTSFFSLSSKVSADTEKVSIPGECYQFGEDSNYNISGSEPIGSTDEQEKLGALNLEANIQRKYTDEKQITAFEIADDTQLKLTYSYDNALKKAGEKEWHISYSYSI